MCRRSILPIPATLGLGSRYGILAKRSLTGTKNEPAVRRWHGGPLGVMGSHTRAAFHVCAATDRGAGQKSTIVGPRVTVSRAIERVFFWLPEFPDGWLAKGAGVEMGRGLQLAKPSPAKTPFRLAVTALQSGLGINADRVWDQRHRPDF